MAYESESSQSLLLCLIEICTDGAVRLAGGQSPLMGRVEVCINEQYGTVCDQGFERNSAAVVCGQLGYSRISKFALK